MFDIDLTKDASPSLTEELYGRPKTLKIFISSKMRGGVLTVERKAAADAVERIPQLAHAWYWERDADAGPYCSEHICLAHAETCDGLILIVSDELTEVTRKEFEAAYDRGRPIYLFIDQRATPDDGLWAFIDEQRENHRRIVTKGFANVSELETHILSAIGAYFIHAVRVVNFARGQARRREAGSS